MVHQLFKKYGQKVHRLMVLDEEKEPLIAEGWQYTQEAAESEPVKKKKAAKDDNSGTSN